MKRAGSLLLAIAAGCWISLFSASAGAQSVNVVTSVIPVAFIVQELGGERVKVAALVPPGASPHTFEPVPSDIRKLARARYFVGIGGGFDAWSEKLLAAAPKGIEAVALMEASGLNLVEEEHHHHHGEEKVAEKEEHHDHGEEKMAGKDEHHHHGEEKVAKKEEHHDHGEEKMAGKDEHHHHGEEKVAAKEEHDHHHGEEKVAKVDPHHGEAGHAHEQHGEMHAAREGGEEHEEFNPHFWLDPVRVRDSLVPVLMQRLIAADPAGEDYYEKRRKDFHQRLTALDKSIRAELAKARSRKYIAFHAAWPYFAERYGLEKVAVVQEFAGEEPTPREVANLVRDARAEGVEAILVEPQLSPRVAQTIGKEFGARTVVVDPLGDPGNPARDTYEELMQFNARAFGQALGGQN